MGRQGSRDKALNPAEAPQARQRLDLWLWYARVARTRSLAAELAESGHVRINGDRARSAAKPLKLGDVLTIAASRDPKVLRVRDLGVRRQGYDQAQLLYDDLTPEAPPRNDAFDSLFVAPRRQRR